MKPNSSWMKDDVPLTNQPTLRQMFALLTRLVAPIMNQYSLDFVEILDMVIPGEAPF